MSAAEKGDQGFADFEARFPRDEVEARGNGLAAQVRLGECEDGEAKGKHQRQHDRLESKTSLCGITPEQDFFAGQGMVYSRGTSRHRLSSD